jgi:hypothetical protein
MIDLVIASAVRTAVASRRTGEGQGIALLPVR